jgi:hypothetical protein
MLQDFEAGFATAMSNPRQCGKAILFPDQKEFEAAQKRMLQK